MPIEKLLMQYDRNPWIDVIRGISILVVILLHMNIHLPFESTEYGKMIPAQLSQILFHSGYYGVMIFFVVSGFLITNNILKRWGRCANLHCGQYYQMRFARIFPCLFALILILSLFDIMNVPGFIVKKTSLDESIFSVLTFHINWLETKVGYLQGSWDVLWSLSVEEMFYFFFPLVCLFVRNERILKIVLVVFVILGPFARSNSNDIWADHSYLSCMDGIAIGCLAALYVNQSKEKYEKIFLFIGLTLFTMIFLCRHLTSSLGLTQVNLNVTLLDIGIAFILISLSKTTIKLKITKPLQWFGRNSYEIYLTHNFFVIAAKEIFFSLNLSTKAISFLYLVILMISGLAGTWIAKYFSEPANRLLRSNPLLYKKNITINNRILNKDGA